MGPTAHSTESFAQRAPSATGAGVISVTFPSDLTAWIDAESLLRLVRESAVRACGDSWLNLVDHKPAGRGIDDLLVLICYCYLQGVFHSLDVVRRLDTDDLLAPMRGDQGVRPEEIRRFRRERRRSISDCLTHTLVALWQRHQGSSPGALPGQFLHNRVNFRFLEPFYLQAQDRVDRAVVLDSMALDY